MFQEATSEENTWKNTRKIEVTNVLCDVLGRQLVSVVL